MNQIREIARMTIPRPRECSVVVATLINSISKEGDFVENESSLKSWRRSLSFK